MQVYFTKPLANRYFCTLLRGALGEKECSFYNLKLGLWQRFSSKRFEPVEVRSENHLDVGPLRVEASGNSTARHLLMQCVVGQEHVIDV